MSDPILLVLASLADGDKHGYAMMEDIHRFANIRLGPGTLYGAITRLEQRGWIRPLKIAGSPATLLHHSRRPAASRRATSEPRSGCQDRADQAEAGMKRVIRFVVGLYPARWRRRYGVEFDALLGDIIPRWRDLFDVLKGALEMQIRIGTLGKSVAVFGVACALLAGAVSLTLSDMYRSLVLIHVQKAEVQTSTLVAYRSELTHAVDRALSQESLLSIMEREHLYERERVNKPMDDAINKMRQNIRIVVKSADTFEVSFDYTDAVRAQQTTRDLIAKLMYELVHGPAGDLTHDYLLQTFEIRDEPTMPQRPVSPNRTVITSFGLGVGILLGAVAAWVRRPTAEGLV